MRGCPEAGVDQVVVRTGDWGDAGRWKGAAEESVEGGRVLLGVLCLGGAEGRAVGGAAAEAASAEPAVLHVAV